VTVIRNINTMWTEFSGFLVTISDINSKHSVFTR